ncbi:MAG: radical SAM protein [bacterium]|nr:MAG: radical SAM protein [bacterium]
MKYQYTIRDYWHYFCMFQRNKHRLKIWGKHFEAAIRDNSFQLPNIPMVQIIPTDACNLRCLMCNQWGKNGYFLNRDRPVQHMDENDLVKLMRSLSPRDSFISIHGGEPFTYKYIERLLELLIERPFDIIFTTNGTLIKHYIEQLNRIKNLCLLVSIDGDEKTHDYIRGKGRFQQTKEGLRALFELRRCSRMPLPLVIMTFVVCEWNSELTDKAYDVARELGVFILNYNMRWFLTDDIGNAYEKQLQKHFKLRSSGAWRGWISDYENHDYKSAINTLQRITRKKFFRIFPPYIITTPNHLRGKDFEIYFSDYQNVFGNESCFMPYQLARIQVNGDLIYCPGHPDIIAGNVFQDDLLEVFNSKITIKFRKYILHHRFPICNRCCGLYMPSGRFYEQKARKNLGLKKTISNKQAHIMNKVLS